MNFFAFIAFLFGLVFAVLVLALLFSINGALERLAKHLSRLAEDVAGLRRESPVVQETPECPANPVYPEIQAVQATPVIQPAVSAPPPPPTPTLNIPPPIPPVQSPAPSEPTKLEQWAQAAWNWLRVGEEWRPEWIPGEYAVAAVQLLRAAALLLLFGGAWFVRYVHEQGWFSPTGRVMAGFFWSMVLIAVGSRLLRRQWRPLGLVLAGLGFALGEFVDWAGANLYEVLSPSAAFAIAAVLAIGAGVMAWRHNALLLGLVALFAGYTAPFFFPEAVRGGDMALLAWILLLTAEAGALSVMRGWRCLPWISLVASAVLAMPVWEPGRLETLGNGWALIFTALETGLLWTQSLGYAFRQRRAPFWFDTAVWAVTTVLAACAGSNAVLFWPLWTNGLPALLLALGCGALALAFWRRGIHHRRTIECLSAGASALLLTFLCLSFEGTPRCIALSAAAVAFVWAAIRWGSTIQSLFAILAWTLWVVYVGTPDTAVARIGRIGSAVASFWCSGLLLRRMTAGKGRFIPLLLWIAWAASLAWGTWEVHHGQPDLAPALALYWSVYALATLVVGLLFARRDVRGAALVIFGAAAGKFLFFDQAGAPTPERVAGFLGVGLLLLLGSAGYIRAASFRKSSEQQAERTSEEPK